MSNKSLLLLFLCFVVESSTGAPSIDTYFTRCSLKASDLDNCILTQARAIWPHFVGGVKKWRVPSLDPIVVSNIALSESGNGAVNVKISSTDLTFRGFTDLQIQSVKADVDKLHFEFEVIVPILQGEGKYDMKGKLLLLPIQGQGDFNFTHEGEHVTVFLDFKRVEKDGKKLMKLENAGYKYIDVAKVSSYFDNLFGNKKLSDNMNAVLSKNARTLYNELKPRIEITLGELFFSLFEPMFNTVDITELFDDVD